MGALLKQHGHKVVGLTDSVFDSSPQITDNEKRNLKIIEDFDTDLVGFSSLTHRYQWNLKFARQIKQQFPDIKIIFGGSHASAVPEVVNRESCVDHVCVGEGEGAILDLVENPDRTDIPNIYPNPPRPLIKDLDSLPFPDKTIWLDYSATPKDFECYMIMTHRNCPYSCQYCFNQTKKLTYGSNNWVRYRSVNNVLEELKQAKRMFPISFILFMDDVLGLKKSWWKRFCPRYKKEIGIEFTGNTHPIAMDEDKLHWLKDGGCRLLMLGLQSGCEYARSNIIGRPESNRQILKVARICHSIDLPFSIDHLFGIPNADRPEYLKESAYLYREIDPFTINTYRLYILPKTPVISKFQLSPHDLKQINQGTYQEPTIRATPEKTFVAYRNLFVFLPLIPQPLIKGIVNNPQLLNLFGKIPESYIWFTKGINNLRGKNTSLVLSYLKALPRFIRQRLSGYRGEFEIPLGETK